MITNLAKSMNSILKRAQSLSIYALVRTTFKEKSLGLLNERLRSSACYLQGINTLKIFLSYCEKDEQQSFICQVQRYN